MILMRKIDDRKIRITTNNPPTKEQTDKRVKELVAFLEKIWHNPPNTR